MHEKLRLLVVEDNPADAEFIQEMLPEIGPLSFQIESVSRLSAALTRLERKDIDLVLLDLGLPDSQGLETFHKLWKAAPDVPVVVLSGTNDHELAVSAVRDGAQDYLVKGQIGAGLLARAARYAFERQKTAEALRESEEQFRAMFEVASIGVAQADPHTGRWLRVNRKMCEITGYSAEEMLQMRIPDITHPQDRQADCEAFERLVRGETPAYQMENRYVRKDGAVVWVNVNVSVMRDIAGRPIRTMAAIEDITARRIAEERIRAQAELLDLAQDAIVVQDMNGCVQYWNKGSERLIGWSAAEVVGKPAFDFVSHNRSDFQRAMKGLLEQDRWIGEIGVITKDERRVTLMSRWTLVRDEQGQPRSVLVISTDLTEQKKIEAQFLRVQRMESVGRLASGIAHDLNNILAPILMGSHLLREEVPPESRELVNIIEGNAQRGADIVKQLLTFARGTEGQKISVRTDRLVYDMARIVQETFPKSITLRTHLPQDLWSISGDPTQLHQVLLNLCVNARDAMPEGGTLTLSAENATFDECSARLTPEAQPGAYVLLRVADTGTGMSPEILDSIFDPFFTTKEPDMGTGLGLSTVRGIVKSHDSFIQVESQLGGGSQFNVYLPALPTSEAAVAGPGAEFPTGHGELVLVADDEQSVRDITQQMLERHGYRVLTAVDGAGAIGLYAQHQAEIQLAMIDLMMPIMDGTATIHGLRAMSFQLKIVAASGASSEPQQVQIADLPVQAFLQKPFTAQQLLVTLQQVLRGETVRVQADGPAL